MSHTDLSRQLQQGLNELGEVPENHPCDSYLVYLDLLSEWNQAYNLTAVKDKETMLTRHVLDSLSILPYIKGDTCLDVGTGAGLPGLILALARPGQHWLLLDSNKKKIRFLNQVLLELKPGNIEVVNTRIEDYRSGTAFTTVTSRALTSVIELYQQTRNLLSEDGVILSMKGGRPEDELVELEKTGMIYQCHKLNVPALDAQRHVVLIENPGI